MQSKPVWFPLQFWAQLNSEHCWMHESRDVHRSSIGSNPKFKLVSSMFMGCSRITCFNILLAIGYLYANILFITSHSTQCFNFIIIIIVKHITKPESSSLARSPSPLFIASPFAESRYNQRFFCSRSACSLISPDNFQNNKLYYYLIAVALVMSATIYENIAEKCDVKLQSSHINLFRCRFWYGVRLELRRWLSVNDFRTCLDAAMQVAFGSVMKCTHTLQTTHQFGRNEQMICEQNAKYATESVNSSPSGLRCSLETAFSVFCNTIAARKLTDR